MNKSWALLLLFLIGGSRGDSQNGRNLSEQNSEVITSNDQESVRVQRQSLPLPGIRVLDPNEVADIIGTPSPTTRGLRKTGNDIPSPYLLQPSSPTVSAFQTSVFPPLNNNNHQYIRNNNIKVGQLSSLPQQNFISNINNNNNAFTNFNRQNPSISNGYQNTNNQVSNYYQQFISNDENEIIQQSKNYASNIAGYQGLKGNYQFNLASQEDVHTDTDALNGVSFLSNDGINNFGGAGVILPEPEDIRLSPKETIIFDRNDNNNNKNFGQPKISPAIELHPVGKPRQQFTVINDNDDKDSFENFVSQAGSFGLPQLKSESDITANNAFSQQLFTIKSDDNSFEDFGISSGGFVGPVSSTVSGNIKPILDPVPTPVQGNSGSFSQSNQPPVQGNSGSFSVSNPTPIQGNSGSFAGSNSSPVQSNSGSFSESNSSPVQSNSVSSAETNQAPAQVYKEKSPNAVLSQVTDLNKSVLDVLKTESSNSRSQFGIPLPSTLRGGSRENQDNIQVDSIVNALTSIGNGKAENIDNTLGGLTIGQLLSGINGKNGIVVLPASKANSLNLPNIPKIPKLGNKISIRETSDEQIVVDASANNAVSSTTTEAPTTRRRSSRRKTTRPPDHIRRSLSDILYAKGQWFGTLLGGVIDYGRIAYDSFNKNLGKGSRDSRESYA